MQINHHLGVVYDSIFSTVIFFNQENTASFLKVYAKHESDIFENYYEFRDKIVINPPESLYPFFYFDGKIPCVVRNYLDKYFDFFNGTTQSFIKLFQDKPRLKRFVYFYYLEPLRKDINIEAVIKGDPESTAMAVALLSSIHTDYPKQIHNLFYKFDELIDELTAYFKQITHKVNLFHAKKKNLYENIINDFLHSEHINFISKNVYPDKKIDLRKQMFTISFFNRTIVKTSAVNNQISLLIGDKCSGVLTIYAKYDHITDSSASLIFSNDIMKSIILELKKGEKSITQLSHLINYSRPTIDKFIGLLFDELAVKVSRKSGNEVYYEINYPYFIAAKTVVDEIFDNILIGHKKDEKI